MPSHHQSAFFHALRQHKNIDLLVRYYGKVSPERIQQGWQCPKDLPNGEMTIKPTLAALSTVPDWQERIHIIEGRDGFRRQLIQYFSEQRIDWIHWGERGARRWSLIFRYPFWCWYGKKVAKYAVGAFAIGDLAANDFRSWGIPDRKIAFLPYAVAPLSASVEPDEKIIHFADGKKVFLYCGDLAPHKGIDVLLKAFARLDCQHWVLVLVGPDRMDGTYHALAQELGIESQTYFRGVLPAHLVATAMTTANVFILPSQFDGWGVVLNEAASLSKALISTTACGAAHHLISRHLNGYRVQANDCRALATAMESYVRNPTLANDHGRYSREIFQAFSPEVNAERLVNALRLWTRK